MTSIPPPAGGQANGNAQTPKDKPQSRAMVLADEFGKYEKIIRAVLPTHVPYERFVKIASLAYLNNPQLADCTPRSMVKAAVQCAEMGLEPSPQFGECAFVPFENSVKERDGNEWKTVKRLEVQLMPMYVGLIKLGKQAGDISDVYAVVVDEAEKEPAFNADGRLISGFYEEQGTVRTIRHVPKRGGRTGKLWAVYGVVKFRDGTDHFEVLDKNDVDRHRSFSKAKDAKAWTDHYDEMAKKTAIRVTLKTIPKSAERPALAKAAAADAAVDLGVAFSTENSDVIDTTGVVVDDKPMETPQAGTTTQAAAPPANSKTSKLGATLAQTPTGAQYDQGTGEVK